MRLLLLFLTACTKTPDAPSPDPYEVTPGPWEATVRWTTWGVPHVTSDTHGGVAYGLGYAFARDHACILLDQIVRMRGERPRWYGRGPEGAWLDEAFGWRELDVVGTAEGAWFGLSEPAQEMILGYTTGFNDGVDAAGLPPACEGAPWVRPITHIDLLAYTIGLGLDGSGAVFVSDVGRATPPQSVAPPPPQRPGRLEEIGGLLRRPRMGSNGWAIGRDRSTAGGILLSNTHFPAVGEKQWFESHLTIPGVLDSYGASLMGVPITNVGFNAHVAWTHTVSYAPRFVAYALELDPSDPTRYRFGDDWRQMIGTEREVEVLEDDGSVVTWRRTTWRSHYGPVIDAPLVGWTSALAFTYRDVNALDLGLFDVWYGMATATSLAELQEAHTRTQGIPWVYTLATDAEGTAWFADTSRVPYLSEQALAGWRALQEESSPKGILASQFAAYGAILLDGADPGNTWVEDPAAAEPGLVPLGLAPQVERTDYVFNANDSHWLSNAAAPLEGYSEPLYGSERTPRSARTRMNARYLQETDASGEDGRFTLEEVEAAALSMRSSITEEALAGVVAQACGTPVEASLEEACAALSAWDGRYTGDARGAVVWRLLLSAGGFDLGDLNGDGGGLFVVPFDPADPLGTPRGVIDDPARLRGALAAAVAALQGFDPIPTLAEAQRLVLDDLSTVGVPGGQYWEGTIGIAEWWGEGTTQLLPWFERPAVIEEASGLTADGWYVNDGNSFILAVAFEGDGPRARAVMTYGQTDDPASPHVRGQSELYASGALRPVLFREEEIAPAVEETITLRR